MPPKIYEFASTCRPIQIIHDNVCIFGMLSEGKAQSSEFGLNLVWFNKVSAQIRAIPGTCGFHAYLMWARSRMTLCCCLGEKKSANCEIKHETAGMD